MTDSDRTRVGRSLDLLRDTLAPYADAAMTVAYGPGWDDRIATEDAERRGSGKKYPVSKTDLAVLLKAIQFQRIAPWGEGRSDPRIRSFASEILTLRNLHAHGDDCSGEHDRLIDTVSRLLRLLGLPIPEGLEPERSNAEAHTATGVAMPATASIFDGRLTAEVQRLGPTGVRLMEIWERAAAIGHSYFAIELDPLAATDGRPEQVEQARGLVVGLGAEVLDLLEEAATIETRIGDDSTALRALGLATSANLVDFPWDHVVVLYAQIMLARETERGGVLGDEWPLIEAKLDRFTELRSARRKKWGEVVLLARKLNDGELLPNILILMGNLELSSEAEPDQALELTRDSVARARMLAAIDPGSQNETNLVRLLRREGALCNDLGRTEDAVRAFARADEIIDRYPMADPDL